MNCPHCSGSTTAKCSIVYKSGASTSQGEGGSVGVGLGIGTGGLGAGIGASSNHSYTQTISILAAEVAPPVQPPSFVTSIAAGLFATLFFTIVSLLFTIRVISPVLFFIGIFATVHFAWQHKTKSIPAYRARLKKWNTEWICLQCNYRWHHDEKEEE
jgi:hypothetical protein